MTALCEGRVGLKGSDGGDGLMSWKGEWLGGGEERGLLLYVHVQNVLFSHGCGVNVYCVAAFRNNCRLWQLSLL